MLEEELEVYGVDWEGLHDEQFLNSQRVKNLLSKGLDSWVGQVGPPDHLNEVSIDPPVGPLLLHKVDALDQLVQQWVHHPDDTDIITLWTHALVYVWIISSNIF